MSTRLSSSLVPYSNHRLSDPPVHLNESDFRRFVPSAIANGWMPAPRPREISLDLGDRPYPPGSPGLSATDDLVPLFRDHAFGVFRVSSGEWSLTFSAVGSSGEYDDSYSLILDDEGSVLFGLQVDPDTLFVICSSSESGQPSVYYTYPCYSVRSIHLFGPLRRGSPYLDCGGYAFLPASYPEVPLHFTF
jgi:hypothetical protein